MSDSKVKCPLCSYRATSHGSMAIHFGNWHYGQSVRCPDESAWPKPQRVVESSMGKLNKVHLVVELSDEDLELVAHIINTSNADGNSHGKLTLDRVAQMLMEDVALALRRPGSWEGSNMLTVLRAHGYT